VQSPKTGVSGVTVETSILKIAGQVAGIGGLALGVFLLIFRDVIRKKIFPTLTKDHAYRLMRLIIVLAFLIAIFGIAAWVYVSRSAPSVQLITVDHRITEIPIEKLPSGYKRNYEDELEVTDVLYDQEKELLDIKVRNNSQESTIVEGIRLTIRYHLFLQYPLSPSGTHDATVSKKEIETAKANKQPLQFERGFNVSYVIPPKGADRYLLKFNVKKSDLYYPGSEGSGGYSLGIDFYYNKGQIHEHGESFEDLLGGRFRNR
jgi:hypothetical protein